VLRIRHFCDFYNHGAWAHDADALLGPLRHARVGPLSSLFLSTLSLPLLSPLTCSPLHRHALQWAEGKYDQSMFEALDFILVRVCERENRPRMLHCLHVGSQRCLLPRFATLSSPFSRTG
jgi:hypothetical protein